MRGSIAPVARDVGRMLQMLSGLVLVTAVVALLWGEFWAIPGLLLSAAVPFGVGWILSKRYADAPDPGKLHGMMVAASGWFFVALFASLPFVLLAWTIGLDPGVLGAPDLTGRAGSTLAAFRNPLNAFFESMSGFTGTGLTMTDAEQLLPHTLQWWRTFIEWIGGVGVIVLTTAILARPGSGSLTLYESEARSKKIHPSIVSTVRTIWWIFLLFTFVSIVALWLAKMPLWDAINHAMTGLSTGGFSITDNSIAQYDSALIDYTMVPVMILGSIAFPIHYLILQGDLRNFYRDLQTRWLIGVFAFGTIFLTGIIYLSGTYDSLGNALRFGLFQVVSAVTCTGFQTAVNSAAIPAVETSNVALGSWPAAAQLTVTTGMIVGAAAGSTCGGIKLIRLATLLKGIRYRISDVFVPETAVRRMQIGDRRLSEEAANREFSEAAIIAVLWILFLFVGLFVILFTVAPEFTLENAIFEVASAQGNVGLSAGITGPGMPTPTKLMLLFNMWIGRLEIIPVLVLLRALFDRGGLYR